MPKLCDKSGCMNEGIYQPEYSFLPPNQYGHVGGPLVITVNVILCEIHRVTYLELDSIKIEDNIVANLARNGKEVDRNKTVVKMVRINES